MGTSSVRYTPVYTNLGWHALYTIRIQTFVLSVVCYLEVPLSAIQQHVTLFETSLVQSRLELPTEVRRYYLI